MRCEAIIKTVSEDNAGEHNNLARVRQRVNFIIFSEIMWSTR